METLQIIQIVVQVVANCVGFGLFLWMAKREMDSKASAFDKIVEVVNNMLERMIRVETNQEHMQDDIREVKDKQQQYLITYNPNKR